MTKLLIVSGIACVFVIILFSARRFITVPLPLVVSSPANPIPSEPEAKQMCVEPDDELRRAALHNIGDRLKFLNATSASLGGVSEMSISAERRAISALREWTATLADPCLQAAYTGWLEFAERGARAAEQELRTHEKKQHWDERLRALRDENARAESRARTIPAPPD